MSFVLFSSVVVGAFKTRLQDAKSQVSALKYNKIKLYQHILFNSLFFSLKDRESGPGTSEAKPGRRIGVFHQNAKWRTRAPSSVN